MRNKRNMATKPDKVFKVGAVRASVFTNTVKRDGTDVPLSKVVLEVRYKDKAGEWKGTHSLSVNEMPKAILALQMAYQWLTTGRDWAAELEAFSPLPPKE
jgi:hypothetical protein